MKVRIRVKMMNMVKIGVMDERNGMWGRIEGKEWRKGLVEWVDGLNR